MLARLWLVTQPTVNSRFQQVFEAGYDSADLLTASGPTLRAMWLYFSYQPARMPALAGNAVGKWFLAYSVPSSALSPPPPGAFAARCPVPKQCILLIAAV